MSIMIPFVFLCRSHLANFWWNPFLRSFKASPPFASVLDDDDSLRSQAQGWKSKCRLNICPFLDFDAVLICVDTVLQRGPSCKEEIDKLRETELQPPNIINIDLPIWIGHHISWYYLCCNLRTTHLESQEDILDISSQEDTSCPKPTGNASNLIAVEHKINVLATYTCFLYFSTVVRFVGNSLFGLGWSSKVILI
jgi:hypothetical protein